MTKFESLAYDFKKSLRQFEKVLQEKKTATVRDSAIKRFEISFDLAWKLIKEYLVVQKGLVCNAPKDCFRQAYTAEVIDYDDLWIEMTDWRNEAVHTYSEELANLLYSRLPKVLEKFKILRKIILSDKN